VKDTERLLLLVCSTILVAGCRSDISAGRSATETSVSNSDGSVPPEPTMLPVEAWVLPSKPTYDTRHEVALKLLVRNRGQEAVRLPVPVVCVDVGGGWGELRLDLFVNGQKHSAECHTADVIEIGSGSEASWQIQTGILAGQSPWPSSGTVKVYVVWQRTDLVTQRDNDFLGPVVSHTTEFAILGSRSR
jgi:hypothetical protein